MTQESKIAMYQAILIISIITVMVFAKDFFRYEIVATDSGAAYKLDRTTGEVTLLAGTVERKIAMLNR